MSNFPLSLTRPMMIFRAHTFRQPILYQANFPTSIDLLILFSEWLAIWLTGGLTGCLEG